MNTGNPNWRAKFHSYAARTESGCIVWQRWIDKDGYGRLRLDGKKPYAHRVAWELAIGEIPDGLMVLHHCDNPPCINPDHLYLGTAKNNWDDVVKRNRQNFAHGENAGPSKLKLTQVQQIISLRGKMLQREIGALFGISQSHVGQIHRGKIWSKSL